jgi:uncharacterized protein with ParB-like and HNH nuclease domain
MSSIANNINAFVKTLKQMLDGNKYQVDYFQREYKWGRKHIEQLLVDLEASFFSNHELSHQLSDVANYNCYYLGPVVLSEKTPGKSIVDGQQRLTSMTLLLIYLNNLQKDIAEKEEIESLIYSKKHGKKSYNIEVPDRTLILDALFQGKPIDLSDESDESVINMSDRYADIESIFSFKLKNEVLPLFIDWVKEKVVFVEIIAYTDENAYTIFETMNDRGLNLTPTEMLKGYILTNVKDYDKINELNSLWKAQISNLHSISLHEDTEFCKAWMRGIYAESIRQTTKGAENEDFEKIGTRFHTWVKDNYKQIGLKEPESFYYFVKSDFIFYSDIYIKISKAINNFDSSQKELFFSSYWGIASSLSMPLILASINKSDDEFTINTKINIVSKFIDIYTVTRTLYGRPITQTTIRYFIYFLVKEIRNKDIDDLRSILRDKIFSSSETVERFENFENYSYDKKFIHFLMARIIFHTEKSVFGSEVDFEHLMAGRKRNRYVLTPLMRAVFEDYKENFDSEESFNSNYASIGNFTLLRNQEYQKFNTISSLNKFDTIPNEYLITSSCSPTYTANIDGIIIDRDKFPAIINFDSENIKKRERALLVIIKEIWSGLKI